jgi:uncharacterized secreted protein with C-terminal beta-propeller domain
LLSLNGFRFPTDGSKLLAQFSVALLLGVTSGVILLNLVGLPSLSPSDIPLSRPALSKFSSYEELKTFLNRSLLDYPKGKYYRGWQTYGRWAEINRGNLQSSPDYSRTNVQVEGVDEADIVKCDGKYLYIVSGRSVFIVKAYPPEAAEVLAEINLNGTVRGLFINGDRLVVFEVMYPRYISVKPLMRYYPYYGVAETIIKVYDVSERDAPSLARTLSVNGSYFNSRMIGDHVYLAANYPAYQSIYVSEGEIALPKITVDGRVEEIDATKVYYSNISDYYHVFTIIIALNVKDDVAEPIYEAFLFGAARTMYVSRKNVYFVVPNYVKPLREGVPLRKSEVHRVSIEGGTIRYEASGEVPGFVLNQFSMDEYGDYFRIATTTRVVGSMEGSNQMNNLYVLDMDLNIVGRLEGLAPGETIYSARFMSDRCYLVTFKKVDPFFVIDLKDPKNPKILGKLKITGYSDYLHPYDENHIIGIGKETVAAKEGDFAWHQGLKISLFDVSNISDPREISKVVVGHRGTYSPILRDHRALLFDRGRNLLAIPILVAEIDPSKFPGGVPPYAYGEYVWQGIYVFNISENGLTVRGRITHIENSTVPLGFHSEYSIKRALYIGNVLYTISDRKVKMNSLLDLSEINEIKLPRGVEVYG